MHVEYRARCSASVRAEIDSLAAGQKTLEDVVRWGLSQSPPIVVDDVVVQDEYTHDVVVTHPSGFVLVYDTT